MIWKIYLLISILTFVAFLYTTIEVKSLSEETKTRNPFEGLLIIFVYSFFPIVNFFLLIALVFSRNTVIEKTLKALNENKES